MNLHTQRQQIQHLFTVAYVVGLLCIANKPLMSSRAFVQPKPQHPTKSKTAQSCIKQRERHLKRFAKHIKLYRSHNCTAKTILTRRIKEAIKRKNGYVRHSFPPYKKLTRAEWDHRQDVKALCCFPMDVLQQGLKELTQSDN